MARGEPLGLDWNVIQRIDCLKKMKEEVSNSDEKGQIPNLDAILKAYRTGKLQWTGLVTYWSKGKQLCEPRPFNWDEFEAINRKFDGHKAFWVEGVSTEPIPAHNFHMMHISLTLHLFVAPRTWPRESPCEYQCWP